MSRNFEVLQRVGKGDALFGDAPRPSPKLPTRTAPKPQEEAWQGRRLHLDIEGLSREEAIRLVRRVFLSEDKNAAHSVVFTGVERRVGCTWNCICAARTLAAQTTGRVCVVDANLRQPALHSYLGVANTEGLAAALSHTDPINKFTRQLGETNLWALVSGVQGVDLSNLSTPLQMDRRLDELRSQFDYLLIDSPAVNLYADALALGQMCDGIVMVLESDVTRRESARRAKQNIESVKARLLGAVLNKRTYPIPQAIYRMLR
jgi:protein-tyrosine kinase